MKTAVIAVGGNALLRAGEAPTVEAMLANVSRTCEQLAALIARGYDLVITHGNGPQVGNILLQNELAPAEVPRMPLDVCGAMSQGQIGYLLQQGLTNALRRTGLSDKVAASIVTQVLVDEHDLAFSHPTKPIGGYYTAEEAEELRRTRGWTMGEDPKGRGFRRLVPSPDPKEIVERKAIRRMVFGGENQAEVVIASGGGGIPVILRDGKLVGVEAVIDKDLAACVLATNIDERLFVMLTDVDHVYLDFRKPTQRRLERATVSELKRYLAEGHFMEGSMEPKIRAAIRFLEAGGAEAVITASEHLVAALEQGWGTHLFPDPR